jgi:hypothetical protein
MGFVARIYLLNKQNGRAVGLELMMKSVYSIPRRAVISLTDSQAELLVAQLQTAINESRAV